MCSTLMSTPRRLESITNILGSHGLEGEFIRGNHDGTNALMVWLEELENLTGSNLAKFILHDYVKTLLTH